MVPHSSWGWPASVGLPGAQPDRTGHLPVPGPPPGKCSSAGTSRPPAWPASYPPGWRGAAAPIAHRGRGQPPRWARAAGWGSRSGQPGRSRCSPAPARTQETNLGRGGRAPRRAAAPQPPPQRPSAPPPPAPSPSPPGSARAAGPAPAAPGCIASAAA